MASALPVERVFSPLDEELALPRCNLAPGLYERLVRLSTWIPSFEHASRELSYFTRTEVPEATVRRLTEAAGESYLEVQKAEVGRIRKERPEPPQGPAVQQLSVDGAMVPLVGGEWGEVKTLVVGELTGQEPGEQVRAEELSYFSRLSDAESFTFEALVETHRRGTEAAGVVVAVNDGAVWEQGFVDYRRVDAVRVLDFCHAAGYLSVAAQAVYGPGTRECCGWVERYRYELRHGEPEVVLEALRRLQESCRAQDREVVRGSLEYLEKRREQIRYSEFELLGIPIGSGIVESANKLLVEERLKGSGMHWAKGNVNRMLALRSIAFNDRWQEAWPQIVRQLRAQRAETARARRKARRTATEVTAELPIPVETVAVDNDGVDSAVVEVAPVVTDLPAPRSQSTGTIKPRPDHPWRHLHFGRSLQPQSNSNPLSKI